jgi:hypothetical protein
MFQTTNQIIICPSIFRIKIVILSEWCGSFGHLGLQIGAVPQFVAIIMAYLRRPANKKNHDDCWEKILCVPVMFSRKIGQQKSESVVFLAFTSYHLVI